MLKKLSHTAEVVLVTPSNEAQHVPWEMTNVITILAKPSAYSTCDQFIWIWGWASFEFAVARLDSLFCITIQALVLMLQQQYFVMEYN